MSTFNTLKSRIRLRIKDRYSTEFSDTELADLVNSAILDAFEALKGIESSLVIKSSTVSCSAGVSDYEAIGLSSIIAGCIWIGDPDSPLEINVRPDIVLGASEVTSYYMNNGRLRLTPAPVEDCTLNYLYFEKPEEITELNIETYELPWSGTWDKAIELNVVLECLNILERSISNIAILANSAWSNALNDSYTLGCLTRRMRGNFSGV
jgi:hypothetical protein